jgi:acylphosphatase
MDGTQASALRALVRGRVQGVGFRVFAMRRARELGLKGFVRNLGDGRTVEVVAEGQKAALEALLAALHIGPPAAHVEGIDVSWTRPTGSYEGFREM